MDYPEFIDKLNHWGQDRVPFLFLIDFETHKPILHRLSEVDPKIIQFDFQGFSNVARQPVRSSSSFVKEPISFSDYKLKFDKVMHHLNTGDSFLTNLTIRTKLTTDLTLQHIFDAARARYKLLVRDQFVVFSPEPFIQIEKGVISSFPMKGTIDAAILNAKEIILKDEKELSEHITIVDLIRNDLSKVAKNVSVTNFRYVEEVKTHDRTLLQVSSKITGQLGDNWCSRIGDVFRALLPAGSISGAPKKRTIKIISEAEELERGYYTGICGYFDGTKLDSGVMIRFIEDVDGSLYYRSGGGITAKSIDTNEYQEAIEKIYVPVD